MWVGCDRFVGCLGFPMMLKCCRVYVVTVRYWFGCFWLGFMIVAESLHFICGYGRYVLVCFWCVCLSVGWGF